MLHAHAATLHSSHALTLSHRHHLCSAQYAFNLFSHTTKIGDNGYNEEEMKMVKETRKIWGVRKLTHTSGPCCTHDVASALRMRARSVGRLLGRSARAPRETRTMIILTITDLIRGSPATGRQSLCTTLTLSLWRALLRCTHAFCGGCADDDYTHQLQT
jgi:hypothetical protein